MEGERTFLVCTCRISYTCMLQALQWSCNAAACRLDLGGLLENLDHMLSLDPWVSSCGGDKYM